MSRIITVRALSLGLVSCLPAAALGQGMVNNGPASYEFFNNAATPGLANFSGGGVHGDQLAWSWWWYRVSTDPAPRERRVNPTPTSQLYTGPTATLGATEPLGVNWSMTWTVAAGGAPGVATLTSTVRVTNSSSAPFVLDLFNVTNPDLGDGLSGDTANLIAPGLIGLGDSFSDAVGFLSFDPGAVVTAGGPASIRDLLDDADINNFTPGGLPFNALTDLGVGLQFAPRTLNPGQSASYSIVFGIGAVPAPAAGAVLLPALLCGARRSRR